MTRSSVRCVATSKQHTILCISLCRGIVVGKRRGKVWHSVVSCFVLCFLLDKAADDKPQGNTNYYDTIQISDAAEMMTYR